VAELLIRIVRDWINISIVLAGLWAIIVGSIKAADARKAVGQ